MSEKNPYRVFIVHLFQEDEEYRRVFEYLESRENFFYLNYSNPENMPSSGGMEDIKDELRNQMKDAEVVILPLAVSESNSSLVAFQIDYAQASNKPILGIKAFGDTVAIDKAVLDRCDDIVEWNERSIISAIKRLARNEDTAQWESLEFTLD